MTGDSGEPIATSSVCSKYWPLTQKYVDVSTSLNNAKMSSEKWWLRRESESSTGTLVKRDTTSKLTIRSPGCTCRLSRIWVKWTEFLTWCAELPVSWLRKPVRCLASWYVGAPVLAHIKKQNVQPPKQVSGINLPAHCSETPQMRSAYCINSYNSNNVEQRLFLPLSLQRRICKKIRYHPKVILQNFSKMCSLTSSTFCICIVLFNLLKPNDVYICRSAALTSRRYILNIYWTNIHTEYFKHAA